MLVDFLVRLKPLGPWRLGSSAGQEDSTGTLLHSDTLYSALCGAMNKLGMLEAWLGATASSEAGPEASVSSLFPYQGPVFYVVPPKSVWPPTTHGRLRWKGARFVPLGIIGSLLSDEPLDESRWTVDGPSRCLVPLDEGLSSPGPFRLTRRSRVVVDRVAGVSRNGRHIGCLEFSSEGGMWAAVSFASPESRARWQEPLKGAFRFLADEGIGGQRSHGWGCAQAPEFVETGLPEILCRQAPEPATVETGDAESSEDTSYWLLSLFNPAPGGEAEQIAWERSAYDLLERSGRTESDAGWGAIKRTVRMVAEGSVLRSRQAPRGAARDVAPPGFPHPVFSAGFATAIPITERTV